MSKHALNEKQRSVVTIAAFTANGDLARLHSALHEGLDAGLTINEIKEILVQLYAYAGFPRSLNGIQTFMKVIEERKAEGIKDKRGQEPTPIPRDLDRDAYGARVRAELAGVEKIPPPSGFQLFTPAIDQFLKEHLFADVFARDNLDYATRELATISTLSSMTGTRAQLDFHLNASLNVGLSEDQLKAFVATLKTRVGEEEAERASDILSKVLSARTQ